MVDLRGAVRQPTLVGGHEPRVDEAAAWERRPLDQRSWVDVARDWLVGADTLLDALVATVAWRQGQRRMWDRVVDDPRLSQWFRAARDAPHPALVGVERALGARYGVELVGPGMNLYRDGRDSVAPHADRELRALDDTVVAIVTLGARRPFLLKPKAGGRSHDLQPGSGDVLVMGGATQLGWTHAVPKVARAGPRLSLSWRWTDRSRPTRA